MSVIDKGTWLEDLLKCLFIILAATGLLVVAAFWLAVSSDQITTKADLICAEA